MTLDKIFIVGMLFAPFVFAQDRLRQAQGERFAYAVRGESFDSTFDLSPSPLRSVFDKLRPNGLLRTGLSKTERLAQNRLVEPCYDTHAMMEHMATGGWRA